MTNKYEMSTMFNLPASTCDCQNLLDLIQVVAKEAQIAECVNSFPSTRAHISRISRDEQEHCNEISHKHGRDADKRKEPEARGEMAECIDCDCEGYDVDQGWETVEGQDHLQRRRKSSSEIQWHHSILKWSWTGVCRLSKCVSVSCSVPKQLSHRDPA